MLQSKIVTDLMGHGVGHQFGQQDPCRVGLGEEEGLPVNDVDRARDLGHPSEGQRILHREQALAPDDEEIEGMTGRGPRGRQLGIKARPHIA